uniref:Uncharacterized protein n=1 Tax=Plectus sambesii TaxID=2011161 RepID=A0A914VQ54_9BILA
MLSLVMLGGGVRWCCVAVPVGDIHSVNIRNCRANMTNDDAVPVTTSGDVPIILFIVVVFVVLVVVVVIDGRLRTVVCLLGTICCLICWKLLIRSLFID